MFNQAHEYWKFLNIQFLNHKSVREAIYFIYTVLLKKYILTGFFFFFFASGKISRL